VSTMGRLADDVRWKKSHPENVVKYITIGTSKYRNVCVAECNKFLRILPAHPSIPRGTLCRSRKSAAGSDELKAIGESEILMRGTQPRHAVRVVSRTACATSKRHHPEHIHGFSTSEDRLSSRAGSAFDRGGHQELMAPVRLDSWRRLANPRAERLRDQVARRKARRDRWLEDGGIAQQLGCGTSVTMMYGLGETPGDRIENLFRVREVQAQGTRGFTALLLAAAAGTPSSRTCPRPTRLSI